MIPFLFLFFLLLLFGFITVRNPRYAFFILVFLSPWNGLDFDVGLRIEFFRIISFTLLVYIFLISAIRKSEYSSYNKYFIFFVVYAILNSVVHLIFLPGSDLNLPLLRSGYLRAVGQIIMFLIQLTPVFAAVLFLKDVDDVYKTGKVYLVSVLILTVTGWGQLIYWYFSGVNPIPIGFLNSIINPQDADLTKSGIHFLEGISLFRMSSFGGEPKGLGQSIVVALILLNILIGHETSVKKVRRMILLYVFLFVSMVATISTSALILWLGGTAVIFLHKLFLFKEARGLSFFKTGLTLAMSIIILTSVYFISFQERELNLARLNEERGLERIDIEDFDQPIIDFLSDQPFYIITGTGIGNVYLYAWNYVPYFAWYYSSDQLIFPKTTFIKIISDGGIFLFLFFCAWILSEYINLKKISLLRSEQKILTPVLIQVLIVMTILFLIRTYIYPQYLILTGLTTFYINKKGFSERI